MSRLVDYPEGLKPGPLNTALAFASCCVCWCVKRLDDLVDWWYG